MRFPVFAIFVTGLVTVTAALLMVPDTDEEFAIALRDKRVNDAYLLLRRQNPDKMEDAELLHLHRLAEKLADIGQAEEALRKYLQRHPENADALGELAELFRFTQQEKAYRDILPLLHDAAPTEANFDALMAMHRLAGNTPAELELARTRRPTKLHDIARTGLLLASRGHFQEAIEMLERLPSHSFGQFRQAHLTRIALLKRLGRDEDAAEASNALTKEAPEAREALRDGVSPTNIN